MANFADLMNTIASLTKEGNAPAIKEFLEKLISETLPELENKIQSLNNTINSSKRVNQESIIQGKELSELYSQKTKLYEELIKNSEKYDLRQKEELKNINEQLELNKKTDEDWKKEIAHREKLLKLSEDLSVQTKNSLASLTGISNKSSTIVGRFVQSSNSLLGFNNALLATGNGVAKFFGAEELKSKTNLGKTFESLGNFSVNILTSSLDKLYDKNIEFVKQQIEMEKRILKTSGANEAMTDSLYDSWNATNQYGVALKDTGQAMIDLSATVNKFNQFSASQREELINLTSTMTQLNISSKDSAKSHNILTTSMKMSTEASNNFMRKLVDVGAMLGDSDKGIKDFNNSMKTLSAYEAPRATQAFMELSKQAYSTGVELQNLLNIASKFDTFDDAATASAKLNAILGGPLLNSTDLLLQTENERIDTIIRSMDASGKHWATLDKFEKKAIATSVGISDMTEANKLFGQSYAEYQQGLIQGQKVLEQQKSIEERAKEAQTVIDKWNIIVNKLIINLKPLVNFVEKLLDGFTELNDKLGGALIPILGFLLAKAALGSIIFKTLTAGISVLNATMGTTATVAPKAGEGISKALTSVGSGGAAAFKGLAILAGISLIMVSVAYSFKILAEAIAILAPHLDTIFKVMSENKGVLTIIALELAAFSLAISVIGSMLPLIALGSIAIFTMGLAFQTLFEAVGANDDGFRKLISDLSNLVTNIDKLHSVASELEIIKDKITELNSELSGLATISLFDKLISDIAYEKVKNYAEMVDGIVSANNNLTISSKSASDSIRPIAEFTKEINNLSSNKTEYFERIANSTVRIIEASKEDNNSKEILQALRELNNSVKSASSSAPNSVFNINVDMKEGLDGTARQTAVFTPKQ